MYKLIVLLITVALLTACAGFITDATKPPQLPTASPPPDSAVINPPANQPMTPTADQNPFSPQPADDQLERGNVYLDSTQLLSMESHPPQIMLVLKGSLPTPCHHLRVAVNAPDAENRITIEVYSVVDPNRVCVQVLAPLDANIPLGSFAAGHYTVWVNGEQIGEFDS